MGRGRLKFAVSSVLYDDAAECLARYELEKFGGVVRRGQWMSRCRPEDDYHESVEDSWVELDLEFGQLEELLAHVRQLAPVVRGRPWFRGVVVNGPRHHEHGPGGRQWFRGPEIPAFCVTIYDTYMD